MTSILNSIIILWQRLVSVLQIVEHNVIKIMFSITNLRNPNSAQDASTKQYTDTNDSLRVLKTGDTMTGNLLFDARTNNIEIGCNSLGSEKYFRIYLGGEANKINFFNNNKNIFAGSTVNVSAGTALNITVVGNEEVVFNKSLSMANNRIT